MVHCIDAVILLPQDKSQLLLNQTALGEKCICAFVNLVFLYLCICICMCWCIGAVVLFQPSQVAATSEPISFGRQVYRPNGIPPHRPPPILHLIHTHWIHLLYTTTKARSVYLESEIVDCFQWLKRSRQPRRARWQYPRLNMRKASYNEDDMMIVKKRRRRMIFIIDVHTVGEQAPPFQSREAPPGAEGAER